MILGMGNMEPNMETVRPASAPIATMYLQVGAWTCANICTSAESVSTSSNGTVEPNRAELSQIRKLFIVGIVNFYYSLVGSLATSRSFALRFSIQALTPSEPL